MAEPAKNSLLVVDDDTSNLIELINILQPEYSIYAAKDGLSAINLAQKNMPDLILLDVIMPDMSGFDVLKQLKTIDETKSIPVVFITGLNNEGDESEGLSVGAVDYIIKPFNTEVVRLRVRHQIQIVNLKRDLESAAKTAETANRAKSDFLAKMSHEIRTPMNAILGISEINLQKDTLPNEISQDFYRIFNSGSLLLQILNDLLDFSKIEAGKLDIIPEQYDISSLINDAVQLNIMRIEDKPIKLELKIDEGLPRRLVGDDLRIKQVLNNLLSNAFKYTEKGTVTLSFYAEETTAADCVTLVVTVQDTGHGMSEEQLSRLFDEYTRFVDKNNQNVEGTGLGLAITYRLIGLMDGQISAQSEPGVGSLFVVRLPQRRVDEGVLGAEQVEELRTYKVSYTPQMQKHKVKHDTMPHGSVLVVDDMEPNLYVAVGLMKRYELQIETAMSGHEAIEKVKNGKQYDIIFMDHMMPEMNGIETTRHLRDMGYDRPIVALTANAVAGQADLFLKEGFNDFVSKPLGIRPLDVILQKYISDKATDKKPENTPAQKLLFVVDDNDDNLTAAACVLEARYRVMTMLSVEKMLALLKKRQPDMILLDAEMAKAEALDAVDKAIPVIPLPKPFCADALPDLIKSSLQ